MNLTNVLHHRIAIPGKCLLVPINNLWHAIPRNQHPYQDFRYPVILLQSFRHEEQTGAIFDSDLALA
jgi:hypothetical protein